MKSTPTESNRSQMEVQYFKDFDTDTVYASVGPMGGNALFRLREPLSGKTKWEFLVPNSPAWDWVHQRIYRNPHVYKVSLDELPASLAPLPEIPRGPFPDWSEYFLPEQPIHASKYPSVARLLKSRSEETVTVFVVLFEDKYETAFGDGEFHDFRDAFLTKADAQNYMDQNRSKWEQFHLRTMSIKLHHEVIEFPDFRLELYDHCRVEEVLMALEAHLRG
jgi:hypothetical protein